MQLASVCRFWISNKCQFWYWTVDLNYFDALQNCNRRQYKNYLIIILVCDVISSHWVFIFELISNFEKLLLHYRNMFTTCYRLFYVTACVPMHTHVIMADRFIWVKISSKINELILSKHSHTVVLLFILCIFLLY